jgi:hypothetical protein
LQDLTLQDLTLQDLPVIGRCSQPLRPRLHAADTAPVQIFSVVQVADLSSCTIPNIRASDGDNNNAA